MTKRAEIKIALERFLRTGDPKTSLGLVRDQRRRPILIPEALVDVERIRAAGRPLLDLGRRVRLLPGPSHRDERVWIIPSELYQISREDPASVANVVLPFGTIIHEHGLWLRYAPGYREIGVNDRGEVTIAHDDAASADPSIGPVPGSRNTHVLGPAKRLVARLTPDEHAADRSEAEAWLRALQATGGKKPVKVEFKTAGIDGTHHCASPTLADATSRSFFSIRDSEMLRIASLLKLRFRKIRREPPRISVLSIEGIPSDAGAWVSFAKKLKAAKKDPAKLGLPARITDSRFYDPGTKGIPPASFLYFPPPSKIEAEIFVLTVNTDSHAEVKQRGVLSPLMSIMALIDIISAHASAAVLNKTGTATAFVGPGGSGKSTAATFWAERNEKYRRQELRRRYEEDLRRTPDAGRMGEIGIQKELDRIMTRVGILCQEDWLAILKEGAGHWLFWPTERMLYARTAGFPGLRYVLYENRPLLENVAADFGGSNDARGLGKINHEASCERLFYDPDWGHMQYDRTSRMITANILLDRNGQPDPLARRVSAREAIDWLIVGRTPDGRFEPLSNAYADTSAVLTQIGVTGETLLAAWESAKHGDMAPIGAGDVKLGEVIFERFDLQVKLWLDHCREIPTYVVNGSAGVEITQDVAWVLSEHPEAFGDWKHVALADFQKYMRDHYGVSYGARGEWNHVPASSRGF